MDFKKSTVFIFFTVSFFLALPQWVKAEEPVSLASPQPLYDTNPWVLGGLAVGAGAGTFVKENSPGAWGSGGGILFDDSVRNALVAGSNQGRQNIVTATNIGLAISALAPFALDSFGLIMGRDHDSDRAWNMAMMDAETLLSVALLTEIAKNVFARPRPYSFQCASNPGYDPGCGTSDQYASFFSGHSAFSFAAATLLCQNHGGEDGLFHSAWADRATCWGALTIATATGIGRIAADQHFATDVLTGAAVGILAGWSIPHWMKHESGSVQHHLTLLPGDRGTLALGEAITF